MPSICQNRVSWERLWIGSLGKLLLLHGKSLWSQLACSSWIGRLSSFFPGFWSHSNSDILGGFAHLWSKCRVGGDSTTLAQVTSPLPHLQLVAYLLIVARDRALLVNEVSMVWLRTLVPPNLELLFHLLNSAPTFVIHDWCLAIKLLLLLQGLVSRRLWFIFARRLIFLRIVRCPCLFQVPVPLVGRSSPSLCITLLFRLIRSVLLRSQHRHLLLQVELLERLPWLLIYLV